MKSTTLILPDDIPVSSARALLYQARQPGISGVVIAPLVFRRGEYQEPQRSYVALLLLGTLILILFPSISLWLPGRMPK